MKKFFIYLSAALAGAGMIASCEGLEDFQTTIDAPETLVYSAAAGSANMGSAKVAHAPVGSFGSFETVFPVMCNTGDHKETLVNVVYSAEAAQAYNAEKGTSFQVLPEANIRIAKYSKDDTSSDPSSSATLTLPENARFTADSVRISLVGDLTSLTEREYLAAVVITSDAFSGSEVLGTYYLKVLTEKNCIRPIESASEVPGFQPDRSDWEYIEGLSGGVTGRSSLPGEPVEIVVDMKQEYYVTGVRFGLYSTWGGTPVFGSIEYSVDGSSWEQAGSPDGAEAVEDSWCNVAFYGYIKARYIKFTADASAVSSWYRYLNGFDIFSAPGANPAVYMETLSYEGMIKHTPAGTDGALEVSFPVKLAPMGTETVTASVAQDNSLVAAYNQENGTSYEALPAANVKIEGGNVSILGGEVASENVTVSLTGDLTGLRNATGYLLPLRLTSPAGVAEGRDIAYVTLKVVDSKLKNISSEEDIIGSLATDRTGWSIEGRGSSMNNAIDGNANTYATNFPTQNDNVVTLNLGAVKSVSGIMVSGMYYAPTITMIELSTDGVNFEGVGVPGDGEHLETGSGWSLDTVHVGFYDGIQAQYVRVTLNFAYSYSYYMRIGEFNVYLK